MRKSILILIFSSLCVVGFSQPYRNEWIKFSPSNNTGFSDQKYLKIKVFAEGIYQINVNTLTTANVPLNQVAKYQIFYQGQEQYIYVQDGGTPGILDGTDFIEFYGKRNDGILDRDLYVNTLNNYLPDTMAYANPNYSMFTDTAVYFLTWTESSANGLRMIQDPVLAPAPPNISYFMDEVYQEYTGVYIRGATLNGAPFNPYAFISDYVQCEAWVDNGAAINYGAAPVVKTLPTPNPYTTGSPPASSYEAVVCSRSWDDNIINDHRIHIVAGPTTTDFLYEGANVGRFYLNNFNSAALSGSTTSLSFSALGNGGTVDNQRLSYIKFTYPHTLDFSGEAAITSYRMTIPDPGGNTYIQLTNFPGGTANVFYDLTNHKRIPVQAGVKMVLTNSGSKTCFIAQPQAINSLIPVGNDPSYPGYFHNFKSYSGDYLIVTHSSLWSQAAAYKVYRESTAGGSHSVILADVDELYDQFAWGIAKCPLSIRNFAELGLDLWPKKPEYLFLIGKSYGKHDAPDQNASPRKFPQYFALDLLPCWSMPASDALFTMGLNGCGFKPAVATGRIAARNLNEVSTYLEKVKQLEAQQQTIPPPEWMKHGLHFSGGTIGDEADVITSYMNNYKAIFEDTSMGGRIMATFQKTTTEPISLNTSDSLKQMIKDGQAIMTFFGHSSTQSFDQAVDDPNTWGNSQGRYPFVSALGCTSGDCFGTVASIGEQYVFANNQGAIGFIGDNTSAFLEQLNSFEYNLYTKFSHDNYGQGIGKCLQATIAICPDQYDWSIRSAYLSLNLQCDPAIKINSWDKPDLMINQPNVYFSPNPVTTDVQNFNMNIITTNLAKATNQTFHIHIKRVFPDNSVVTYDKFSPAVYFKDTLSFSLPVESNGGGLNHFEVTVDYNNEISELDDTGNNFASVDLFIESTDLVPVYPRKYAIIPQSTVTLKASTASVFAVSRAYVLEIDTAHTFDSPFKKTTTVTQSGGVVSWGPITLLPTDSTVYFWRARFSGSNRWRESSFIYISNKTGWSQKHFMQYQNGDSIVNIKSDTLSRIFNFRDHTLSIVGRTHDYYVAPWTDGSSWLKIKWILNGLEMTDYPRLITLGVHNVMIVGAINPQNGQVLQSIYLPGHGGTGIWGERHASTESYPLNVFEFRTDPVYQDSLAMFLNAIPNGYKVIMYTGGYNNASSFSPALLNAMYGIIKHSRGHVYSSNTLIDSLHVNPALNFRPYIGIGTKGKPNSGKELFGQADSSEIQLEDTMVVSWTSGKIISETIGPASSWTSLHWRAKDYPASPGIIADTIYLNLIGIKPDGTQDTLIKNLPPSITDSTLASISATAYPYLKLYSYIQDDSLRTPQQLAQWQIYYVNAPEAALNPYRYLSFLSPELQQGDSCKIHTVVENIGDVPISSLWVDFWVNDSQRKKNSIPHTFTRPLVPGDFDTVDVAFPTISYPGTNSFWIEANPYNSSHVLEQEHFNNLGYLSVKVNRDVTNPLLDVTFDGIHILNGDIVSAKPSILIQLKDENKFLVLDDTSNFVVWLRWPDSDIPHRLRFEPGENQNSGRGLLQWRRAQLPENRFRIELDPVLTLDGIYELTVDSRDKSDNVSGKFSYKITFEVINKSTITEVLNYPNPFTTSTRFAFVLTGSEVPTYFKIQIMTVTGKVVREITRAELGNIHIGRNLTDYAWNATDEYGDRLANGVYLYRVITRLNGESIEHRASEVDPYFKKGWGKLYLMR